GSVLERQRQVVDSRQKRFGGLSHGVIAEFRALPGSALPIVIKLGLQTRQPVEEVVTLLAKPLEFRLRGNLDFSLVALLLPGFFLKAVIGIGGRKFVLGIQLLPFFFVFHANVSLSVRLAHIYCTWSSNWNVFHAFSFSSLSNSCAM